MNIFEAQLDTSFDPRNPYKRWPKVPGTWAIQLDSRSSEVLFGAYSKEDLEKHVQRKNYSDF